MQGWSHRMEKKPDYLLMPERDIEQLNALYEEEYESVWKYILKQNPGIPQEVLDMMIKKVHYWDGDDNYSKKMKHYFNVDTVISDEFYRITFYDIHEWIEDYLWREFG